MWVHSESLFPLLSASNKVEAVIANNSILSSNRCILVHLVTIVWALALLNTGQTAFRVEHPLYKTQKILQSTPP